MSERLFIWDANATGYRRFNELGGWLYPWTVSLGRPADIGDFIESFKTLPEAHDFAKGFLAAERATP